MLNFKYLIFHPLFCKGFLFLLFSGLFLLTGNTLYLLFIQLAILLIIVISLHELGHWLFGFVANMNLQFIVFSFALFKKEDKKIRLKLNNNLAFSFGVTKMYFTNSLSERNIMRKKIWYYAGGSLLNLSMFLISLLVSVLLDLEEGNLRDLLIYFMNFNLIVAVVTALPFEETDGGIIFKTIKQSDAQIREEAQIDSYYYQPIKQLSSSDVTWLKGKMEKTDNPEYVYTITILLLHYYLSCSRVASGREVLQIGMEKIDLAKGKETKLLQRIIEFYIAILEFSQIQKLSSENYEALRRITFWYGETFYTIAKAIIYEQDNKEKELKKSLLKRGELLDPNQEGILRLILT